MSVEEIKQKMLQYTDFYGGDIYDTDAIKNATTKQELSDIVGKYRDHLTDCLSDAHSHLDNFKNTLGLNLLP